MFLVADTITCRYDLEEDRLVLSFNNDNGEEINGLMTRQFLKELLTRLPAWLVQQHAGEIAQPSDQQRLIDSFQHQMAQQQVVVTYGNKLSDKSIDTFLIHSVNLAKNKKTSATHQQKINLAFLDRDHAIKISIGFTLEQLHKLIGEILKQVRNWDLTNPWLADDRFFVTAATKDNLMH